MATRQRADRRHGELVDVGFLQPWAQKNPVPSGILICAPNLTVKPNQVLRPEEAENYYDTFDIVPKNTAN